MVLVTLLWSSAGVVSRFLQSAQRFEVTFWRSLFCAATLLAVLLAVRGRGLWRELRGGGRALWASALCWTVMFTNFMLAMMLTKVAVVLVTMAIAPLITALFSRLFLKHQLPARTWAAIAVAGVGIVWMFGRQAIEASAGGASMAGALVALGVPLAGVSNWTLLQHLHNRTRRGGAAPPDMLPAVLIGALLSALVTLPLALPWRASAHDLGLLALLGVFQLALPCLLVVRLARVLPAAEISLIGLLEVIFGVLWAWWWAGESPGSGALAGGALVVAALLANELAGLALARAAALARQGVAP